MEKKVLEPRLQGPRLVRFAMPPSVSFVVGADRDRESMRAAETHREAVEGETGYASRDARGPRWRRRFLDEPHAVRSSPNALSEL